MKTKLSKDLKLYIQGGGTALAYCWNVRRLDRSEFGFTSLDDDIIFKGVTYLKNGGWAASAVESTSSTSIDNMDVEGAIDGSIIDRDDVLDGVWDHFEVEVFIVAYEHLDYGKLVLRKGNVGEIKETEGQFFAEIRGLMQKLTIQRINVYAPACDANPGDGRCKVSLASFTDTGTVTSITDNGQFKASGIVTTNDYYSFGRVVWLTGLNAGRDMDIKYHAGSEITLVEPMPKTVGVGDTYSAIAGCDLRLTTCKDKFSNIVNFRGFPSVPGLFKQLTYGNPSK